VGGGNRKPLQGLTTALKERLIQDSLQRRLRKSEREREQSPPIAPAHAVDAHEDSVPDSWCRFDQHPRYQQLRILNEGAARLGISNPYFRSHEGIAGATTVIDGSTFVNFSG